MNGCVYMIKNINNHKVYIGQTSMTPMDRWKDHVHAAKRMNKYPLQKAINKDGITAFSFQILETNLKTKEEMDEKEKFYIEKYQSYDGKKGYNVTKGGSKESHTKKLTDEDVLDIIALLKTDTSIRNIAEEFHVNRSTISDINCGDTRRVKGETYPIRHSLYDKKHYTEKEIDEIYELLQNGKTATEIAKKFHVSKTTISKINHGKIYRRENVEYPIKDPWKGTLRLDFEKTEQIAILLKTTNESYVKIGKRLKIGRHTISEVNNGNRYRELLEQKGYTKFPIRDES